MDSIDSYSIVLNLIQLFSISAKIGDRLGNIVVKNIKGTPLLRSRLLKSLRLAIKSLSRDKKTHLNITTTLSIYATIIRTKGIEPYAVYLVTGL